MVSKKGYELLKEKVPDFKNPLIAIFIFICWILLFSGIMVFFWWFDSLFSFGPVLSQFLIAVTCTVFAYIHIQAPKRYRKKYRELAYRYFFFHFIVPIFATWYAMILHPLIVTGDNLLSYWIAIPLGLFFISIRMTTARHIQKSGFDEIGHGFGIFTVFPEEGTDVTSEIYSFIRHPIYSGGFFACFGFAFLRNNMMALFVALIFLIPILIEVRLEDREMIERYGKKHQTYLKETGALSPKVEKIIPFLKFLFT